MELQKEVNEWACSGTLKPLPAGRPGVPGTLGSFLGIGESLRDDRADAIRGPALCELPWVYQLLGSRPPPPEPVLRIASPPADSDVLPGTGEGAADPLVVPTFRI